MWGGGGDGGVHTCRFMWCFSLVTCTLAGFHSDFLSKGIRGKRDDHQIKGQDKD